MLATWVTKIICTPNPITPEPKLKTEKGGKMWLIDCRTKVLSVLNFDVIMYWVEHI